MPREDKRPKSRYWMLTGFDSEPSFDQFTMNAMRVGREICPTTKKEHYHACIQFVSEIRVTTIKQIFPKQNLQMKKGNKAEFFAYSKKDGDFKIEKKKFEKNPIAIYYIYNNIYNIIRHGWVRSLALPKASVPWVGVGMGG
jgi:hypothetical protein